MNSMYSFYISLVLAHFLLTLFCYKLKENKTKTTFQCFIWEENIVLIRTNNKKKLSQKFKRSKPHCTMNIIHENQCCLLIRQLIRDLGVVFIY